MREKLRVGRFYTKSNYKYDDISWDVAGLPEHWSDNAKAILRDKYMYKPIEKHACHTFDRLAHAWTYWGMKSDYFESDADAQAFRDELKYMLVHQIAAPNSPQWFNTGLYQAYDMPEVGSGSQEWYTVNKAGYAVEADPTLGYANIHACYIQSIDDHLHGEGGIYDLIAKEGRLFYEGSGTGSNFSKIRAVGEPISGGGTSSGLMSFLKVFDAAAGSIKSGGRTRRAAKMVCLDIDHPEIQDFIRWKVTEEMKVAALHEGVMSLKDLKHLPKSFTSKLANTYHCRPDSSLDWRGELYQTVSGQNSNNSVRVTDLFMRAVGEDKPHKLVDRTNPENEEIISARVLWDEMCTAAWACADPGLQFHDTINNWNTCAGDGQIRASNPCSEYMFLDDTACNLASIRLTSFWNADKQYWDWAAYLHAIRLWTIVLDISIEMSRLPSKRLAERTHYYRTLGLGYCDLGALLMRMGVPYDSVRGRRITEELTAALTMGSYDTSHQISQAKDRCPALDNKLNKDSMGYVLYQHREAANLSEYTLEGSLEVLDLFSEEFLEIEPRNAQATAIAPTGTIGLLMDCDTTGIEPEFAMLKHKILAGGGSMSIVSLSAGIALKQMGFHGYQIKDILDHIEKTGSAINAPHLKEGQEKVFACANDPKGNAIRPASHVELLAAITPLLSGSASKTVNLPEDATLEDVSKIYSLAWVQGCKAIAVYRDQSKLSQPLVALDGVGGGCSSGGCSL